jgi:hypothetical protein
MAHIIALVVKAILVYLYARTYANAAILLQAADNNRGVFSEDYNVVSVWLKIRTFVLYVMASDKRRAA